MTPRGAAQFGRRVDRAWRISRSVSCSGRCALRTGHVLPFLECGGTPAAFTPTLLVGAFPQSQPAPGAAGPPQRASFPPLPLPPLPPASHSLAFHYERLLRQRRHPERAERVEGSLPSAPCATARQSSALCTQTITRTPPFLHSLCLLCLSFSPSSVSLASH